MFFKKWANPGLFSFIFGLFKQTIQFLQQINVKKCPSSIQCWHSNPRPFEDESSPIITRPAGLLVMLTLECFAPSSGPHSGCSQNVFIVDQGCSTLVFPLARTAVPSKAIGLHQCQILFSCRHHRLLQCHTFCLKIKHQNLGEHWLCLLNASLWRT